jgi:hypothetical protein
MDHVPCGLDHISSRPLESCCCWAGPILIPGGNVLPYKAEASTIVEVSQHLQKWLDEQLTSL